MRGDDTRLGTADLSFPRKRESRLSRRRRPGCWIPACAGMTVECARPLPRRRHRLWLSIMALPNSVDPASPCPCGSGLRFARCCGLDWTAAWPEPGPAPEVGRARAALTAGDAPEAERLLVELLERSPTACRRARAASRACARAQGRTAAAEALLSADRPARPQQSCRDPGARAVAVHPRRARGGRGSRPQRRAHRPDRRAVAQSHGHDHDRGAAAAGRRAPLPPGDGAARRRPARSSSPISPGT